MSQFPLRLDYGRSLHAYVNQRLQIQLELLTMSGVPLETCWAFNERWNNKFHYRVVSCLLFLRSEICCWSDARNGAWFLNKWPTCWIFCLPKIEDTAVVGLTDIVLKLRHPVVSRSSCRIVGQCDLWHELVRLEFQLRYVSEVERKHFCLMRSTVEQEFVLT
jgi:hypothetical protein